jgi:hypothetical protein
MGQLRIFIFALFSLVGASTTFFMGRREYFPDMWDWTHTLVIQLQDEVLQRISIAC